VEDRVPQVDALEQLSTVAEDLESLIILQELDEVGREEHMVV
jgi:hypothetical protein